jgi:signal transduction histidine kinase/DNA-binding response OmpR family regulator/ligand-binding sensor domain-containing protein
MKKTYCYFGFIILLFFFISKISAQNYSTQFQKIGLKEGLSSYTSNYIFQDSRGIIWIATSYGLNRYDGNSIKYYTNEQQNLRYNNILVIAEDDQHNLWITSGGYDRKQEYSIFDPLLEKFYSVEEYTGSPLPFNSSISILQPMKGKTLLVNEFKKDKINCYEVRDQQITKLFEFEIKNRKERIFAYSIKISENLFYMLTWDGANINFRNHKLSALDRQGNIINQFSCEASGPILRKLNINLMDLFLFCVDQEEEEGVTTSFALSGLEGADLGQLKLKGDERFLYLNHKVYLIEDQAYKIYSEDGILEHDIKLPITIDNPQRIFISEEEDLYVFQDRHLYVISFQEQLFKLDLHDDEDLIYKVRSILKTSKDELYVTGLGFLTKQSTDSKIWTPINMRDYSSLIGYVNLTGFLEDAAYIWIGSEAGKLLRYDTTKDSFKEYWLSSENLPQITWTIHKDAKGKIWSGASRGLYYLDPKSEELIAFKADPAFPLLKKSSIYSFHTNAEGTWIATTTGLYLLDLTNEKILAHYHKEAKKPYNFPSSYIAHIHEDKEGIFWLATKGDGLIKWDPKTKKTEQLTRANAGFSSDVIYAVYEDELGYLWLPSSMGLMRLQKESRLINLYFMEDGLPENEFNTLAHYKDKDGTLYFGTQNGLIHFHPKAFEQVETKATLRLLSCNIFNRGIDSLINQNEVLFSTNRVELTQNDKYIEFNFALLDCKKTKGNQYSYKIEGYDKDWTYQSSNILRISNLLPYGRYTLRFRAKTARTNKWLEYSQPIQIHILKPFYLQIWFLSLVVGLLGLSIFLFIRSRTARLLKQQRELESIVQKRTAQIEEDKTVIELQAQELIALDKLKSRFFANISHELRTPLTLILGPLSYILDHPEEWKKEHVIQQLQTMQRNGKSLMQLIEEILDLSKLEANKLELEEEVTPVQLFFQHIFEHFKAQFASQKLMALCSFDLSENLYALIDRKKIEKVVNNYLSNAIKFTPQGGQIRLHISEKDQMLHIEVSDSGQGIHPNDLPHIFERFYQSKQVEQKLYGGTGIGLALVKEFASLMQADTGVESQLGKGSTFHFKLPLKAVEAKQLPSLNTVIETEELDLADSIGSDFTILVVEDNPDMRDFIQQILQKEYKTVLTAENGKEGLAVLRKAEHNIQLIISDIMMPEMDGLELLKVIKTDPNLQKIPVIMLTALAAERDKLNALIIGVDDYLTKPFSVPELVVRSKNLLYNYQQRQLWQDSSKVGALNLASKEEILLSDQENATTGISEEDLAWIKEVEVLISSNLNNQIPSVEELAGLLFISSRQLRRKIKFITGFSPIQFIREVQLQAARKELEDKVVISITELAYNNGFEQLSTFSKLFKKRFGKSPTEYLDK